jgi:hypothetical protein
MGDLEKIVKNEGVTGLAKSKNKIEEAADKLKKVAEENKADPDEIFALKSDPVKTDTPLTQKLNKAVEEARQQMKEIGSLSDADRQKKQIQDALRSLRDKRIYEMGSGKEGDVRTALRQFLQKELETGKLDIPDAYERKMIAEVRQGGVDPIDVFRKAYGEDALIAVDDIFEQYGDKLRGPTYRDIEENFRKLFKFNRGFYDMADLPVPKKEYGFEEGLRSVDTVEEELMKQYRQLDELDKFEPSTKRKPNAEGGIISSRTGFKEGLLAEITNKNLTLPKAIEIFKRFNDDKEPSMKELLEFFKKNPKYQRAAEGGIMNSRIALNGGGSPLQKLKQEIVDSMKPYAPGISESKLQAIVKDITLDMSPEEAQASAVSNFQKMFGMATGGRVRAASGGLADILKL